MEKSETASAFLTALKSVGKTSTSSETARHEYQDRLSSFATTLYCAKPACLSPIFCARFGWRNADKDILCCLTCGAVVAVIIPSGLSITAMETLCAAYRTRLAQAHDTNCTFRLQAEQYMKHQMNQSFLPTAFSSIFPQDEVELLEHPSPAGVLRARVAAIQDIASQNQCEHQCVFPKLDLPHELHAFLSNQEGHSKSILDHVAESGALGTNQTFLVGLAVLGWKPTTTDKYPNGRTSSLAVLLRCPLCLSDMELSLIGTGEEECASDSQKRQKRLPRHINPFDAHRYYCPFICGFPSTMTTSGTPLWKVLLEKIEGRPRSRAVEHDSWPSETTKMCAIVQSGIQPQKVDL